MICILPDTPDFATTEEVSSEYIEPKEGESSELEDVIEEQRSEEQIEREEDEEAKDNN